MLQTFNVSRSVVQRLWGSIQIRRFCVQKSRATTPAEDSSFGTKEKNHYCAAARLQTTFKHQEEESPLLRSQCRSVSCCVPLNGRQRRNRLLGKRTCFLDAATMDFCAVHRRVQIYNGE
ncbi:hypothetical protein TNCV_1685271 [Trichonephila clavipes]|nr:hypothetical protein TNCV_1685271 [Trichonephila clavipes]